VNASDKEQVKQRERQSRRKRLEVAEAWKILLATVEGRRVFAFILDELQPSINLWNRDQAALIFNCARHDVGQWLREQIDAADPDALLKIFTEHRLLLKQERSERDALLLKKQKPKDPEPEE
jgi:hypothetical protein